MLVEEEFKTFLGEEFFEEFGIDVWKLNERAVGEMSFTMFWIRSPVTRAKK